jgi:hypothetical protein
MQAAVISTTRTTSNHIAANADMSPTGSSRSSSAWFMVASLGARGALVQGVSADNGTMFIVPKADLAPEHG